MPQEYSYQFPEHFEQTIKSFFSNNEPYKNIGKLIEQCDIKYLDTGRDAINFYNGKHAAILHISAPTIEIAEKLQTLNNNIYSPTLKLQISNLFDQSGLIIEEIKVTADRTADNVQLPEYNHDNLKTLHQEIQEKLYQGQPELALDRLHTFATTYLRKICTKYQIDTINKSNGDNLPLHSLIGSLVKKYEQQNCLSEFSTNALKSSILIFDKYNKI